MIKYKIMLNSWGLLIAWKFNKYVSVISWTFSTCHFLNFKIFKIIANFKYSKNYSKVYVLYLIINLFYDKWINFRLKICSLFTITSSVFKIKAGKNWCLKASTYFYLSLCLYLLFKLYSFESLLKISLPSKLVTAQQNILF